jgi:hypothetical protein
MDLDGHAVHVLPTMLRGSMAIATTTAVAKAPGMVLFLLERFSPLSSKLFLAASF